MLGILDVALHIVRGDRLLLVALEIAVRVFAKPQVRHLRHEDAALHQADRPGHDEAVEEHGPLVHAPVGIRVFKHRDAARRLVLTHAIRVRHITRHLHDPDAAVGIKLHRHRRIDQRLGGDQLDAEARLQLKGLKCLRGRQDRCRRNQVFGHKRLLHFARFVAVLGLGGQRREQGGNDELEFHFGKRGRNGPPRRLMDAQSKPDIRREANGDLGKFSDAGKAPLRRKSEGAERRSAETGKSRSSLTDRPMQLDEGRNGAIDRVRHRAEHLRLTRRQQTITRDGMGGRLEEALLDDRRGLRELLEREVGVPQPGGFHGKRRPIIRRYPQ